MTNVDQFPRFLMGIYTPRYDKRSKSYEFLNISQADRLEQPGKTAFLTTEISSFQTTCSSKLIANFLHFPVVTHMPESDKR
jgi:hypothetical protein